MNLDKLKNCPFCGSDEVQGIYGKVHGRISYLCWIECLGCGGMGPQNSSLEIAIEKWSSRIEEQK